jgi:pyruvate formate lyase activating enzyme
VPGYNDTADNLQAPAGFVSRLGLPEVNILPFHRLGASKHEQLDLDYPYAGTASPSPAALPAHQRIFATAGLPCYVGFETPF